MGGKVMQGSTFSGYEINIHMLCKRVAPVDGVISAEFYLHNFVLVHAIIAKPFRLREMTQI